MATTNNQETAQLSAKECHFLQSMLQNLLSSGAKVDWNVVAKECEYKTGASAYMGFSRIKKKLGWTVENGSQDAPATNGKTGTKRRAPTKKEKLEQGDDEANRETEEDDGTAKKRVKRNVVKKEKVVDEEVAAHGQDEALADGAAAI